MDQEGVERLRLDMRQIGQDQHQPFRRIHGEFADHGGVGRAQPRQRRRREVIERIGAGAGLAVLLEAHGENVAEPGDLAVDDGGVGEQGIGVHGATR